MVFTLIFAMHIKRFLGWIGLKQLLHFSPGVIPHVNERDVWWASLGENVGFEINGKSGDFTRPVIIFRKLSQGFFFVIPLTTQARAGTWYARFRLKGRDQFACLHQARSIDYRRLHSRLGRLDDVDFAQVERGFLSLYCKNIPRHF